MSFSRIKKCAGLILVFLICATSFSTPFRHLASYPHELRLFAGQSKLFDADMPVMASVMVDNPNIVSINGAAERSIRIERNHPVSLQSKMTGETELQLKLFGKLPVKKVKVQVVPDLKVYPGGQTIGVKIQSDGILVVGHHLVQTEKDNKWSPGEQADLRLGDLIVSMNGQKVDDLNKVAEIVKKSGEAGKAIKLELKRGGKMLQTTIRPALDVNDHTYRLGVYIRNSAAGVGTLTFYAPEQHAYGALGHVITDMDTHTAIVPKSGEVVQSSVSSISKSHNGDPGEKRAHFFKEHMVLGNIEKNTQFGIFGSMNNKPEHGAFKHPIPVAFAEEVKEGPAEILTVVSGQKVESFRIEILHAAKQQAPATKGLIIRITDPRLLEKTGGIVQGMSGSPIIQNGKLVGAVTHVFVNDPSSGYGCYIEWMLQDAGITLGKSEQHKREAKAG